MILSAEIKVTGTTFDVHYNEKQLRKKITVLLLNNQINSISSINFDANFVYMFVCWLPLGYNPPQIKIRSKKDDTTKKYFPLKNNLHISTFIY